MSPRRAVQLGTGVVATFALRVLVRLAPHRWCPPWISLHLVRMSSRAGNVLTADNLRQHQPPRSWTTQVDLRYAPGRSGLFDLVVPEGPGPHPVVIWMHGGGWHFGDKSVPLPYLEMLASRGYAGVVPNYPLAPGSPYPAAPRAINAAIAHVTSHAPAYGIDQGRVVLAGDSAGAQVAAEVATAITSPEFAGLGSHTPALDPTRLRGVLLFCGIYDTDALDDSDRMFEAMLQSAMWSLGRRRSWKSSEANRLMSVRNHVTSQFPPTLLAAGNADPLTRRQTPPMASRLRELGVEVDEYSPGTPENPVNHEFQFQMGTPEGVEAFERVVRFLDRVTAL